MVLLLAHPLSSPRAQSAREGTPGASGTARPMAPGAPGPGPADRASPASPADAEGQVCLLMELVASQPERGRRRALEELERLGPWALPEMLSWLERGAEDRPGEPATGAQREVLLEALCRLPRRRLALFLRWAVEEDGRLGRRLAALEILSAAGTALEVPLALRIAVIAEDGSPRLGQSLEAALVGILGRDERAYGALGWLGREAPPDVGSSIVSALAQAGGARALSALESLLGSGCAPEAAVLGALGDVAARQLPPFDEFLRRQVRERLGSETPATAAAAARALGRLADDPSIPALIAALEHADPGLRAAALAGLRELTRLSFGGDPRRWRSWHASEMRWWEESAETALARLRSEEKAEVAEALGEAITHRLHRDVLAARVAELVGHPDAALRHLACEAAGALESSLCAAPLAERLDDAEPRVRDAARRSLRALLGGEPASDEETEAEALRAELRRNEDSGP